MKKINELLKSYRTKKEEIEKRLKDFKRVWNKSDKEIFSELCFCILTPQSKAELCDRIIRLLKNNKLLYKGTTSQIRSYLKCARFYKNKSRYIIEARKLFLNSKRILIKKRINKENIKETRNWLVGNVKGIGYKEASHFLRNIGLGEDIAILDVHILRNLVEFGVIKTVSRSLSRKKYIEIENKLRDFSRRIKIPMAHLDLLFWSNQTGKIFK